MTKFLVYQEMNEYAKYTIMKWVIGILKDTTSEILLPPVHSPSLCQL